MGWAGGSELLAKVADAIKQVGMIGDATRVALYTKIVNAFADADCDTVNECEGIDPALDLALGLHTLAWHERAGGFDEETDDVRAKIEAARKRLGLPKELSDSEPERTRELLASARFQCARAQTRVRELERLLRERKEESDRVVSDILSRNAEGLVSSICGQLEFADKRVIKIGDERVVRVSDIRDMFTGRLAWYLNATRSVDLRAQLRVSELSCRLREEQERSEENFHAILVSGFPTHADLTACGCDVCERIRGKMIEAGFLERLGAE